MKCKVDLTLRRSVKIIVTNSHFTLLGGLKREIKMHSNPPPRFGSRTLPLGEEVTDSGIFRVKDIKQKQICSRKVCRIEL